jgi:hypothetical protein
LRFILQWRRKDKTACARFRAVATTKPPVEVDRHRGRPPQELEVADLPRPIARGLERFADATSGKRVWSPGAWAKNLQHQRKL